MLRFSFFTWTFLLCLLANAAHGGSVSFSADKFTNWSVPTSFGSGGIYATASPQDVGGKPDEYFQFTSLPITPHPSPDPWLLWGFRASPIATFVPATGGAIESLDFSFDANLLSGPADGLELGLFIRQASTFFVNRWPLGIASGWTHKSRSGLLPADFVAIVGLTEFSNSITPDFSTNGLPIDFGLFFFATVPPNSNTPGSTVGIDNWSVTVNTVPEPSTIAISCLAFVGLASTRRRK